MRSYIYNFVKSYGIQSFCAKQIVLLLHQLFPLTQLKLIFFVLLVSWILAKLADYLFLRQCYTGWSRLQCTQSSKRNEIRSSSNDEKIEHINKAILR